MNGETVYIVEEVQEVVSKASDALFPVLGKTVNYMYGHPSEIVTRLQQQANAPSLKNGRFPLVVLFTDIPITKGTPGFYGDARLRLVIANITEPTYTAPQRLEKSFKPILHPIKEELLKQLGRHQQFTKQYELQYTETDLYYWGKNGAYGVTGNVFNDFLDGIELVDVQVTVKNKFCLNYINI